MRVALANGPKPVDVVELAALVTGDDARGHIQRTHQDDEAGGNVLAETFLAVKPEFISGVLAIHTRLQCVAVAAGAQAIHHGVDQLGTARCLQPWLAAHVGCQLQCARVKPSGQGDVVLQAGLRALRAVREGREALSAVAGQVRERAVCKPLQIRRHSDL